MHEKRVKKIYDVIFFHVAAMCVKYSTSICIYQTKISQTLDLANFKTTTQKKNYCKCVNVILCYRAFE